MPVIEITGPIVDTETKRKLAKGVTEVACAAYNMPPEKIIVFIRENDP